MISSNGSACSGTAIRGLIKDIIEAELIALGIYTPPTANVVRTSVFRREH